jgi:hypothetical protein
MDIFWESDGYGRVARAEAEAGGTRTSARHLRYHIKELQERVDQMSLKCQALWEIVREATDLSDVEFQEKIKEIDLRDGAADGRITQSGQQCGRCGKTVSKRHSKCLYCGEVIRRREVF